MKTWFSVLISAFLASGSFCHAQDLSRKMLMEVAGREITAGEFTRMFNKSYDTTGKTGIDEYLDLFIIFKLKVADAISEGLDTTDAFRKELKGYRDQLAAAYLTDPGIKEKMLMDAYSRTQVEISASHILVTCRPDATPADTIKAWEKISKIRERTIAGESFNTLAASESDDPSAKSNMGNLGYFTAFQMVAPFENAAFALNPGEISQPVRTSFGYHLIKVNDRRPASGKVKIAHIMFIVPQGAGEKEFSAARLKADSVYAMLENGESFTDLVRKYSDHKESIPRGGELNWFGAGEIISEIAEPSLALRNAGDFTQPVRSPFGWHIIKLLDRKPPQTFDESKTFLESRLNPSIIQSMSRKSFTDRLKSEYNYRLNKKIFQWFVTNTDTAFMSGSSDYSGNSVPGGHIYEFAGQKMPAVDFALYTSKNRSGFRTSDPEVFISRSLDNCLADHLYRYEDSVLETKYPEFGYLVNEFHDGILLFEISGRRVWDKAQTDTTGLKDYYRDIFTGRDTITYEKAKEELIPLYQDWLEKQWIIQLKKNYIVRVNDAVLKKIRKKLFNE
jgi:peptidyl-prolyl cis-trans isomerase SurA